MNAEELFAELHKLNRIDKLRAMEVLVLDLAAETLMKMLDRKSESCVF